MSDIDEERSVHEILGEEQRLIAENEKISSDVERLMRVLSILSPRTKKAVGIDAFDTIATIIIDVSNSNFDNKAHLICSLEQIYSYIISADELIWDDLFARLYGVAEDIITTSNMRIYNPVGYYFNQCLSKAKFTSSRTKECIEQYAEYNFVEEARWIATEIYNQFWNILMLPSLPKRTEDQAELSKLYYAHKQEIEEWRNSNRRPSNQNEFDIKKYINCFKMEFARQDEEYAEIIVRGQERLEWYKEEARRKTEQQRALAQMLREAKKEELKEQKNQQVEQEVKVKEKQQPVKKKSEPKQEIDDVALRAIILAAIFVLLGLALVLCPLLALN